MVTPQVKPSTSGTQTGRQGQAGFVNRGRGGSSPGRYNLPSFSTEEEEDDDNEDDEEEDDDDENDDDEEDMEVDFPNQRQPPPPITTPTPCCKEHELDQGSQKRQEWICGDSEMESYC